MKLNGKALTADQGSMFIQLSMGNAVQAVTPNGKTVELRPIPHYNSLDWGFAMWDNGKQVSPDFSIENEAQFAKIFLQLHKA
jgi:hypothetical protein